MVFNFLNPLLISIFFYFFTFPLLSPLLSNSRQSSVAFCGFEQEEKTRVKKVASCLLVPWIYKFLPILGCRNYSNVQFMLVFWCLFLCLFHVLCSLLSFIRPILQLPQTIWTKIFKRGPCSVCEAALWTHLNSRPWATVC